MTGTTLLLASCLAAACSPAPPADRESETETDAAAVSDSVQPPTTRQASSSLSAALPGLFDIMWGLADDMGTVSRGIWMEDFDTIRAGAHAVAEHPALPPDEVEQVAAVLGEEMGAFKGMDTRVHDISVALGEAAAAEDLAAVLGLDVELRAGCVSCHTTFRERLRESIGTPRR